MNQSNNTNQTQQSNKGSIQKIGNTTYEVSFHFSESSKESMEDKVFRLIDNDLKDSYNLSRG